MSSLRLLAPLVLSLAAAGCLQSLREDGPSASVPVGEEGDEVKGTVGVPEGQVKQKKGPGLLAEIKGLLFELREPSGPGVDEGAPAERLPPVTGRPVEGAELAALWKRVPELEGEASDAVDFALRESSLPPPKTGVTTQSEFPPKVTGGKAPALENERLQVLRAQPEGAVKIASELAITFSQPMVAVTSLAELAKDQVPVTLDPQPAGRWRWVGTKTLMFKPDIRFPMSTTYTAIVPKGTKAPSGAVLAEEKRWTFTTPPPRMEIGLPTGSAQPRSPVIIVGFDQAIDPAQLLGIVVITAADKPQAMRLATPEEIASDVRVAGIAERHAKDRLLAMKPINPFPPATQVNVTIPPGTPSREGPGKTKKAQSFSFETYHALQVAEARCGWYRSCAPGEPFYFRFNNPLDAEGFKDEWVKIEPAVAGLSVNVQHDTIVLQGSTRGRTKYTFTFAAELRDSFGQTLETPYKRDFTTGSAEPALHASSGSVQVADPTGGAPSFTVRSVNYARLEVRAWRVDPEDLGAYLRAISGDTSKIKFPGKKVHDGIIAVGGEKDELQETAIALAPWLVDGRGHLILEVRPPVALIPQNLRSYPPVVRTWVQVTGLGLTAVTDSESLTAWVSTLADGQPLKDVSLELLPSNEKAVSLADGTVEIPLPKKVPENTMSLLVARQGKDVAFLAEQDWMIYGSSNWVRSRSNDQLRVFTFDDRHMYRPGEVLRVKGYLRLVDLNKHGDVLGLDAGADDVTWRLRDSQGNEVGQGRVPVTALGGFYVEAKLPGTMNLGWAGMELTTTAKNRDGNKATASTTHTFSVQEFRRPEFEVAASAGSGPFLVGGEGTATVKASYYAGGGLPNAAVQWTAMATPAQFSPPNWPEYSFGRPQVWDRYGSPRPSELPKNIAGVTDAAGEHTIAVDLIAMGEPRAMSIMLSASVTDVNRQAWGANTQMLVHPARHYVGLKLDKPFVEAGQPIGVSAIVADLDGKAISESSVDIKMSRLEWRSSGSKGWREEAVDEVGCSVSTKATPERCAFKPSKGGRYRILATINDLEGRSNQTEMSVWVAGGGYGVDRSLSADRAELLSDKKSYRVGDTAELLIRAPFSPAEGLLVLERSGVVKTMRFSMKESTQVLNIKIEEGYLPNVIASVTLIGAKARTNEEGMPDPSRPKITAYARGTLNLSVPPAVRALNVVADPRDRGLEPGGETSVTVRVQGADGKPVAGAEVALVVVDESVLALSGHRIPNPLDFFYSARPGGTDTRDLRGQVVEGRMQMLTESKSRRRADAASPMKKEMSKNRAAPSVGAAAPMADMEADDAYGAEESGGGGGSAPIVMRTNFDALAVFAAAERTQADGTALVKVKLPDNLTRYRITAVAVAGGKQFGLGEASLTARKALMVRPSAPRFLNFGDEFELPIVVQNQTDAALETTVAVRVRNLALTAAAGYVVKVPANDRVEVRFPAKSDRAGTGRFQAVAVSGKSADAALIELPIWTPATTEAFATYGEIDDKPSAVAQPFVMPADAVQGFGGLEITTASTQLQALTDAVVHLVSYPYECSEQISSRVLAVAALKDVLNAFEAEGLPNAKALIAAVDRDFTRLTSMQNGDGGFGFWSRGRESWPFNSIHVAHAMARAKSKGFKVDASSLAQVHGYLQQIESHYPSYYGPEVRRTLTAYALFVRQLLDDRDASRASRLIREGGGLEKMPIEAVAWLYPVLAVGGGHDKEVAEIRRFFNNRVTETAGTAHFATSYTDGGHLLLHSDRRADGLILDGLMRDQPKNDLVAKIVRGLLAHRVRGHWSTTQDNVWVLLALDRYFHTYEGTPPNFVSRVWLGDRLASEHRYRGRTTEQHELDVPMTWLASNKTQGITVAKEGPGRLYYRIGMRYAPTSLKLEALDQGFVVERRYRGVDRPEDVKRDADGTWRIKAGTRVRVQLTMVATSRRYHVALVDPLPAGLEAINSALKVSEQVPPSDDEEDKDQHHGRWWWGTWYEHENLRDERVEAFTSLLWEGVHTYEYVARATTPGRFVVPPTKAEEMYAPETFGRSQTDRVIVE